MIFFFVAITMIQPKHNKSRKLDIFKTPALVIWSSVASLILLITLLTPIIHAIQINNQTTAIEIQIDEYIKLALTEKSNNSYFSSNRGLVFNHSIQYGLVNNKQTIKQASNMKLIIFLKISMINNH